MNTLIRFFTSMPLMILYFGLLSLGLNMWLLPSNIFTVMITGLSGAVISIPFIQVGLNFSYAKEYRDEDMFHSIFKSLNK